MQDFIIYLIKANIVFSFLFLLYWLLLRNEKFINLNRIFLLLIMLITFLLPLAPYSSFLWEESKVLNNFHERLSEVSVLPDLTASEKRSVLKQGLSNIGDNTQKSIFLEFSFFQFAIILYFLTVFILFTRFVIQLVQLSKLLAGNETKTIDGIVYHTTEKPLPPFSFFQHLVICKSQVDADQIEQIVAHEKVHIKQWHMIDILSSELLQMILWINPFAWMFNRSVKLNLEYIADEKVLKSGFDPKNYQMNIVTSCLNPTEFALANLFTSSKIKLRIKMMNAKNSPLSHLYKYGLILPVISAAYFITNPLKAHASIQDYESQTIRLNVKNSIVETKAASDDGLLQDGSPLIIAVRRGNLEVVKKLVEGGADVNLSSPGDGNPLINACLYGQQQIASFLVDRGADVNAMVEGDETPLINACRNGNLNIVQHLVTHGANVNLSVMANPLTRPELRSPLNQAIRYKHPAVEAYLRYKGAKH